MGGGRRGTGRCRPGLAFNKQVGMRSRISLQAFNKQSAVLRESVGRLLITKKGAASFCCQKQMPPYHQNKQSNLNELLSIKFKQLLALYPYRMNCCILIDCILIDYILIG